MSRTLTMRTDAQQEPEAVHIATMTALVRVIQAAESLAAHLRERAVSRPQLVVEGDQLEADVRHLVGLTNILLATSAASPSGAPGAADSATEVDADVSAIRTACINIWGYAGFIRYQLHQPRASRERLADYADGLRDELTRLMELLTESGMLPPDD